MSMESGSRLGITPGPYAGKGGWSRAWALAKAGRPLDAAHALGDPPARDRLLRAAVGGRA